jgi:hypothetical protein
MCLYITCRNLMVNVDQQHNLQRQSQNKRGKVHKTVIFRCCCVTIIEVYKQ